MGLKYTKTVLSKLTVAELRSTAEDEGFDTDELKTKAALINALLEVEDTDDEVEDEEEADDEEADDEVDDEEEDDELPEEDEVDTAPAKKAAPAKKTKYTEGEGNLGAKEVATQVGTDAKTLRQFFRSPKSTVEPVGAGGRYEFKASDIAQIKTEFEAWKAGKPGRGRGATATAGTTRRRGAKEVAAVDLLEEVEEIELEDLEDEVDDEELELDDEV